MAFFTTSSVSSTTTPSSPTLDLFEIELSERARGTRKEDTVDAPDGRQVLGPAPVDRHDRPVGEHDLGGAHEAAHRPVPHGGAVGVGGDGLGVVEIGVWWVSSQSVPAVMNLSTSDNH